mmetsp:Transcript_93471/g.171508  ORF Transcript_93471/g.171508 Transcript_93471/m.171508 type:complete len:94 (-) Transcript_93471:29-310(-)
MALPNGKCAPGPTPLKAAAEFSASKSVANLFRGAASRALSGSWVSATGLLCNCSVELWTCHPRPRYARQAKARKILCMVDNMDTEPIDVNNQL